MNAPQWVSARRAGNAVVFECSVCGIREQGNPAGFAHFAQQHSAHRSAAQGYDGLGDVVARGTKALGIAPCTPCEARRRMLNSLAPRVMRRR